jgi:stalled ribosome rescue protein Dom34
LTHHFHAVVWIDHLEAKVFHFNRDDLDKLVLHPDHPTRNIHRKANTVGSGHAADSAFLHEVAQALSDAGAILITGPANAKTELMTHLTSHDPKVAKCVSAVETVDHPSDGQLVELARKHFKSADMDTPQVAGKAH